MNFSRSLFFVLLLALIPASAACVGDDIAVSSSSVSGRPFFELFKGADGEYYFNLTATNHEVILSSQGYVSRTGALGGILSTLNNSGETSNYDLREASNGQFYFVLKAANGQIIGMSELYASKSNASRGIATTIRVSGDYLGFLATRTGARFTMFEGKNKLYYFNLKARNGEIVLSSQAYRSEASAYNAAFAIVDAGLDTSNYEIHKSANGGGYFTLHAANGEAIATSETYHSTSNARRGRDSVVALLPSVEIL